MTSSESKLLFCIFAGLILCSVLSALQQSHNKSMPTQSEESNTPIAKKPKSFGNGYRKPITDEDGLTWCNCANPNLTSPHGRGLAWCMKCKEPYYH